MLPLGLIVGAIALELVDVSGASAALQAEIRDQAQRAIVAETRQEVPATACSEADCDRDCDVDETWAEAEVS